MSIMQKGPVLQFECTRCKGDVCFSVVGSQAVDIRCSSCNTPYTFSEKITEQLTLFEGLCLQIQASKEILGMANIGIDVGEHQVKIPYKLLLSRFNSSLDLTVGGKTLCINFRMEPVSV